MTETIVKIFISDAITFGQYKAWLDYSKNVFGLSNEEICLSIDDEEDEDWDEEEDGEFYPVPVNKLEDDNV